MSIDISNNFHNTNSQGVLGGNKYSTKQLAPSSHINSSPKSDIVQLSKNNKTNEKNKQSNTAKIAAVALGILGSIATIAYIIKKNRYSEVKQLAEHIEFQKATTLQDAINFGKEKLGIKHYCGFEEKDLDVINWVNEGITNTSNRLRGKLRIPNTINYTNKGGLGENSIAGVVNDKTSQYWGYFALNRRILGNLRNEITEAIKHLSDIIEVGKDNTFSHDPLFNSESLQKLARRILDFQNNKISTFDEQIALLEDLYRLSNECTSINKAVIYKIKTICRKPDLAKALAKNGVEINIREIEKLSTEKQSKLLTRMFEIFEKENINASFIHTQGDKFRTIYHEMGHLQDDILRTRPTPRYKTSEEYPTALKEWLNNEEAQRIASCVSEYSCSGEGEFIAETFAELIAQKRTLNEDVINLYKKLNGPQIPE